MDIGAIWYCALVSCTPSQSIGLCFGCALFWCWVSLCVLLTNSLITFYSITTVVTIIGIYGHSIYFELHTYTLWNNVVVVLQIRISLDVSAPGHSLWILIELVSFVLLYAMCRFSTRVFYRGVPCFAINCTCCVWRRWLTTCLLHIGPLFGNLVWSYNGFGSFRLCFTYIFMTQSRKKPIIFVRLVFTSQIVLFWSYFSTLILHICSLDTSYKKYDIPFLLISGWIYRPDKSCQLSIIWEQRSDWR